MLKNSSILLLLLKERKFKHVSKLKLSKVFVFDNIQINEKFIFSFSMKFKHVRNGHSHRIGGTYLSTALFNEPFEENGRLN